ncbi:MAG: lipid-A-disaccharide synthase [Gammaproteobacteria bacterium]|nr:lipid-A-disaccharide synthase [Gammaproteobacteria bacterium]
MKIGLVAGESSGDLLGAGLIRALRERVSGATFEGVAGPAMVAAGCEQWEPSDSLAVMGLVEPLAHIPRLLRLRRQLLKRWQASPPDVFVGIDAPDFNLGLEKKLRRSGIKTVHYVSPSVWAWRPGRIQTVKAAADRVLCILPFEKPLYDELGVDAVFIGHPKADSMPAVVDSLAARQRLELGTGELVAVLPGSRGGEVARLGAILAETAKLLAAARPGVRFVTPVASPALRPMIEKQLADAEVADNFLLVDSDSETVMMAADVVLLASGTAALESALLGKPTIAVYRVAPVTYAIVAGLRLVKLSHYTLPNLLTADPLVPEFMQKDAKPAAIAAAVDGMLDDPERRRFISDEFAKLRSELALDANQRAAESVLELARSQIAHAAV